MEDKNNKKKDSMMQNLKNNNIKNKNKTKISCCASCCSQLKECSSKIPILVQFIIFIIPISLIIALSLIYIHIYFFSEIYKFDFYIIIKEEFLRYFITNLDDNNSNFNQRRTSLLMEDISNLVFFKIYFEELSTYGLFDENDEKIFPNISNESEDVYKSLEFYNTIFSIPKNMSEHYIDSRNDSLSELYKIYYYFFPLIAAETNSAKTFINQTFLIAYKINEKKDIEGDVKFFNFPRINEDFVQNNNNFHPYNNLIAPRITGCLDYEISKQTNDENKVYDTNWFIYFDCQFRKEPIFSFYLNFFHLNENNKGSINKTNVVTMQSQIVNNKNETFILNIIFFFNQKNLAQGACEDSVFLVSNYTYYNIRKYSDFQTFILTNNDITEIALSSHLSKYFHYGLISLDESLYSDGIFYDNININLLAEPSKTYSTIDGFNFDIRYFSSYYLYSKLFETSQYSKEYMETDNIYYYIFNNSLQINKVCSKFDFRLYINSLNDNDFDCFNDKNLLYYTRENIKSFFSEGLTLPYCICLPLYCIKNLEGDFDINNIEFVDEIILPEKCQSNLVHFANNIEHYNRNKNISKIDLSNIDLKFGESLEEHLESQYIKFSYEKKNLNGGLSFVFISVINNDQMKTILVDFVERINKSSVKIIAIYIVGTLIIFILFTYILMSYIYTISKVIYEYKDRVYIFLNKLSNSTSTDKPLKNSDDKNNTNYELFPLLLEEETERKNIKENDLINDLYKIYSKFYSISDNNEPQINKSLIKINKLKESNELFKLFLKLSFYIPKFKLNINIDYDFYKDSKLIKNIDNNFSKKLISNEYKEQILYTKGIVKELLSTEIIDDCGLITNLNFNYITNLNLDKKNYIKKAIFKRVEELKKGQMNQNKNLNVDDIKIIFKNKNIIMKKIEAKFEQDDYLNLHKLDSYFNNIILNSFYNYTKRIIIDK